MTAIVGYIKNKENCKVSFLAADNLEGNLSGQEDKIMVIGKRYYIAFVGLEIVKFATQLWFYLFDNFKTNKTFHTPNELIYEISNGLKYSCPKLLENKTYIGLEEQTEKHSQIIILDSLDNKLYYSNPFKVFHEFNITLFACEDGFVYEFGINAIQTTIDECIKIEKQFADKKEIINFLEGYFIDLKGKNKYIGELGSCFTKIESERNTEIDYFSTFRSNKDVIDNFIKRRKSEDKID